MNRESRKLSKIPEEVRQEVQPFYLNRYAIENGEDDHLLRIHKLTDQTADIIQSGLVVSTIINSCLQITITILIIFHYS